MEHVPNDLSQTDTVVAHAAPSDYGAQQNEMKAISSFDWFSKKMLPSLLQVTAIIAVAAIGMFGSLPATIAAGVGMLGFELARAHINNKADLNRELVLYHKEIAHAVGKSPSETLTIADMRNAADEKKVGDNSVKPLKLELEHLAYRGRYNFLMAGVRALVTIGGAVALQGMMAPAKAALEAGNSWATLAGSAFWPLTGALGAVTGATIGIETMGKKYFDSHEPLTAYHELTQLQDLTKKQQLTPEPVFAVVVKLDKELAKDIQDHLGKPYAELSYRNKTRVMQACESRAHAQALTEAINNDVLPVTSIAMSACHQMDWPSFKHNISALNESRSQPQVQIVAPTAEKSFVADLAKQRVAQLEASNGQFLS